VQDVNLLHIPATAFHPPVAPNGAMIRIVIIVHPAHTPMASAVTIAPLRSPIAPELDILSRFPVLISRLPEGEKWLADEVRSVLKDN
jgi:hypothetical protein